MTSHPSGDPQYPGPYPPPYAPAPYPRAPYPPGPCPQVAYPPVRYATPPTQADRRWLTVVAALLVAAGVVAAGFAATHSNSTAVVGVGTAVKPTLPNGPTGPSQSPQPSTPGSTTAPGSTSASAKQQIGVVTIVSVLRFQQAESAGTGMILSADGEILTNNHVINGATSITVTDETTDRSYRADVVGTAPTKDVAVLKLRNASGLQTAALASTSGKVKVGDAVVGVGNAGGTGRLTAAAGAVTALNRSITASDESGQEAERLQGLIEINARIISGDSGGPLYDATGKIIGINTAASSSRSTQKLAYAIPIDDARSVVRQIESGVQTATIHIGLPGFLGITSKAGTNGVTVQDVVTDGPADRIGITGGSVITAVDGTRVTTPQALRNILTQKDPGDRVSVSWTAPNGAKNTKTATLTTGPAD